ncbi:MAG: SAM-dependent methyltransferase, partial [Acidimicrobiales bacterium]|nr:SAM-dependent methyltransferase [Acidimicrobiales bacterium]
ATAIDQWWQELGNPADLTFIEVGAGKGTLARTILRSEFECRDNLKYLGIEISGFQRSKHPSEIESGETMPADVENGIIFANELLDNLPFDIFESTKDGKWKQVCIGIENGGLKEILIEETTGQPDYAIEEIGIRVPSQKAAQDWLEKALKSLRKGRVIVIDYAVENFPVSPDHNWLRTYSKHERSHDPLSNPGTKDITSDIDISQLKKIQTPALIRTQSQWLKELGIDELVNEGKRYWLENIHKPDVVALEARSRATESKALLDDNGLGGFKVIEWDVKSSDQIAQDNP